MSTAPEDQRRNVVPRLRSFITTLALGELDPSGSRENKPEEENLVLLENDIRAWRDNHTGPFAADLVSSAFVLGKADDAKEAAEFLLSAESHAPTAAMSIAARILAPPQRKQRREKTITDSVIYPSVADVRTGIHVVRQRLRVEPRNALLWTELAREYALLGLNEKAERAMDVAVSLGGSNRFVLRSAARLYIHVENVGKAHYVLRKATATRYDPWLLSAEIAVASAAKRSSHLVRDGRKLLQDKSVRVFHKSELASAVGTLELYNGKVKLARDLFKQALTAPTENSVAQAEWVQRQQHIPGLDADLERVRTETPLSFEARAWDHFINGSWDEAFEQSLQWLNDQPFSTRPVKFGSFIASCILEDYGKSEKLIQLGLRANPHEPILLNNLAFDYASSGDIHRARKVFDRIESQHVKELSQRIAITATQGLLEFRSGAPDAGRALYSTAITMANSHELRTSRALASIYLAREETLAQTSQAERALEIAAKEIKNLTSPGDNYLRLILARVLALRDVQSQVLGNPA